MSDETKAIAIPYHQSTNIAKHYIEHLAAMQHCENQQELTSFGVSVDFKLDLLRDIAATYSVSKKAFVVIDWDENGYEVQRLPNGSSPKLFYKHCIQAPKPKPKVDGDPVAAIETELQRFLELTELPEKVTERMFESKVIPYSYLQNKVTGLAVFRKAGKQKTELFKSSIVKLIETGRLEEIPGQAAENYGTRGTLYYIREA